MTPQPLLAYAYWIALAAARRVASHSFLPEILFFGSARRVTGCASHDVRADSRVIDRLRCVHGQPYLPGRGTAGDIFLNPISLGSSVGSFDFRLGLLIDGVSSLVMVAVTLVSLMMQVYSIAYMHGHPRFGRYFAYINFSPSRCSSWSWRTSYCNFSSGGN